MRSTNKHWRLRLSVLLVGLAALAPLALYGSAGAAQAAPAAPVSTADPAIHGTIKGFSTGDFLFADALSTKTFNLAQASIAQSAAGVSNKGLQTTDTLGQKLLTTKSGSGHNAYGRAAGVSANLGQGDKSIPQIQLTQAEAVSPPRNSVTTKRLLNVPLAPLATVDVQPDVAQANTISNSNFCVLGAPLSEGTATVTDANVLPVSSAISVVGANGTVRDDSTEELDPNGHGALGLNSVSTLNTAGITLLKGTPAAINLKVVNPLILDAFAGGVAGTSKATYGSADGAKDVLSITVAGMTTKVTAEQLLGGQGLTITLPGLLKIQIGGTPTISTSANGQTTSAAADLVSLQVLGTTTTGTSTVGGPLASLLNPVLTTLENSLNSLSSAIGSALSSLGLTKAVDLRVGHFEANAQVPDGGITCGLPVSKTTNKNPVTAGQTFTVTIRADNPYDCVVRDLRVEDHITATGGVVWTVGATRPKADKVSDTDVVWDNLGSVQPGGHKDVQVDITIGAKSTAGTMSDTADVTASCGTGNGPGTSNVDLHGKFTLHAPKVHPRAAGHSLPDTGLSPMLPIGGGLLLAAGLGIAVVRRRVTG